MSPVHATTGPILLIPASTETSGLVGPLSSITPPCAHGPHPPVRQPLPTVVVDLLYHGLELSLGGPRAQHVQVREQLLGGHLKGGGGSMVQVGVVVVGIVQVCR